MSLLKGINMAYGNALSKVWPALILDVETAFPPADAFRCGPMLIVSRRVADLIIENVSTGEVEYLPVEVRFQGRRQGDYGVLNVLVVLDALDRNSSEYTEIDGLVDLIDRVSIDEAKAGTKSIFLLDAMAWVLCVNDGLANAIESDGSTGVVFKTPEQWRPY